MGAGPQDFGDGPSSHTSQRLPDVGAGIGPTHLPLGQQLSIQGSGSGSQGWLREGERNRAEPTIAEMWVSMATWIWWPGAAVLPLCALGPQSWTCRAGAMQQPWLVSSSSQHRRSMSEGPLPCRDGPAKAARQHLSSHGRPSMTMAAGARTEASACALRLTQRRSLPPALAGGSGVRLPDGCPMDYSLLTASIGPRPPPGLELGAPSAQPSHDRALTGALSYPHRSLDGRRLRHRRPRLDRPRSWARSPGRYRRHQHLRRPPRRHERGALVRRVCICHVHVHAPDCLLTHTNSL